MNQETQLYFLLQPEQQVDEENGAEENISSR